MRILKYITYIIMVCIALVVGGAIFIATSVNPNDYKSQISEEVTRETGRKLTLGGDISWSFFPWLGLTIRDAELSNAPGFPNQPFLKIHEAAVEVKLLPLLHKKIEIGSLQLTGLELQLSKNAQGVSNWEDLRQRFNQSNKNKENTDSTATSTNDSATKSKADFAFSISEINISKGRLIWDDQQQKQHIVLRDIEFHSKNALLNTKFPITLSLNADINKMNAALKIEGSVNALAQTINISTFNTTLANLNMTGQMEINNFLTAPGLHGQMQIHAFDARQFLKTITGKASSAYDPTALKTVSATFSVRATPKNLELNDIKAQVDESKIAGNITINDFDAKNISMKASIDQMHIDRYLESKEKPAKLVVSNVASSGTAKLGDGTLQQLAANGRLHIGSLQAGEIRAASVDAHININKGLIILDPVTAQLYQGKSAGNINIDMRTPLTRLSARQTLTSIQIQPLLHDLKALTKIKVRGGANVEAQLAATGKDTAALTRSLNGQVKFAVNNGVLEGIDIDHTFSAFIETMDTLVRNIKSSGTDMLNAVTGKLTPALKGGSGETKFTTFKGTINLNNGVASNNDMQLQTGSMTATGTGTANLVTETIDYRLVATKIDPKTNKLYDYELPIVITGPMANPKMGIDSRYLNQVIQKEIARAAKKKLADVVAEQAKKHLGDEAGKKLGEQLKNLNLDKLFK